MSGSQRIKRYVFAAGVFLFSACTPTQIINMKEKVIERSAPPRPGIQVDRFLYRQPMGSVDVLLVVDNTESFEAGISFFDTSYAQFVTRWSGPSARRLNWRLQVATTPRASMPKNFMANDLDSRLHLGELFDRFSESPEEHIPYFTQRTGGDYREKGYPDPFQSTAIGLSHEAFKGRDHNPLFLVFVLGHDVDPALDDSALKKQVLGMNLGIETTRGLFQTHVLAVSRNAPGSVSHCQEFHAAKRFIDLLKLVRFASLTTANLCDPTWNRWEEKLFEAILALKQRLILSQRPFEPWTMTLRAGAHLYRYGDDYEVDLKTNEVVFKGAPASLADGDLLEASYFLEPISPEFSGSPTPQGQPSPTPRPTP